MAAKGGGAWKVAYADFVTAMMAFFLVMWICGQDQKIKRAVAHYFVDPYGADKTGSSKKPSRTGSVSEFTDTGTVPQAESAALGRGRNSYTAQNETSRATKLASDWLHGDGELHNYWREQAARQLAQARKSKGAAEQFGEVEKTAVQRLANQLRDEFSRNVPPHVNGLYQDLLFEMLAGVNWTEIAEDLLSH